MSQLKNLKNKNKDKQARGSQLAANSSKTMDEIIKKVKEMRKLQQQYFRTRDKQVLARAKAAESAVDKLIAAYDQQGKLF